MWRAGAAGQGSEQRKHSEAEKVHGAIRIYPDHLLGGVVVHRP